jgi:hypothetical protein
MMVEIRFAVNLRVDTATDAVVSALRPWGWLAAPGNASQAAVRFANQSGRELIADNGNFARIGRIATAHRAEGRRLRAEVTRLERTIGRSAQRRDLPASLATAFDLLAATVVTESGVAAVADQLLLDRQLKMRPTRLIGVEDLVMAALLAVHIEPQYLDWPRARWRTINRDVARRAAKIARAPAEVVDRVYTVASALDHASAFDAGREFARAGIVRVAMGFGAYMSDDYSEDRVRLGRRTVVFGEELPMRYIRTALVARGFVDGYRAVAGTPPQAFHFLGLGAPIMLGVVAVAAAGIGTVSFDAMSPIRDAVEGTLYSHRGAYLKIRTRAIARRICDGERSWHCACPFCTTFAAANPSDEAAARAWGAAHPGVAVPAQALRPVGELYGALPLLAEPAGGSQRRAVSEARAGHNQWVLTRICAQLQPAARAGRLEAHVGRVVERYERATNSPRFARAVRFGFDVARGAVR